MCLGSTPSREANLLSTVDVKEGVVVEYNGRFWGYVYENDEDWTDIEHAIVLDPRYCKTPMCHTYSGEASKRSAELKKGRLLPVRVTTRKTYQVASVAEMD